MSGAAGQHSLRQQNLATVTEAIYGSPTPLSRAGVAERTGLTKATVSALVTTLLAAGIVAELPLPTVRGLGRPGVPLGPRGRSLVGLGLEVGADYYGGRVLDLAGEVVAERTMTVDLRGSDPSTVMRDVALLASGLVSDVTAEGMRVAGARLAVPGLVRVATGRLEVAPNLGWRGVDLLPLLDLGGPAVQVGNEAKLAGLAQTRGLQPALGPPLDTFVYVSGGVGIGSALVRDGALYQGSHGWSGEIGHVTIHPEGPRCRCGNRGCLEQYAGEEAIVAMAGLPREASIEAVRAAALAREPAAVSAIDRAADALGRALSDYLNLIDVDTVVLGGIYADLFEALEPVVSARIAASVLSAAHAPITVLPAPQRDHAALTGGARAVLREVLADPAVWAPGRRHT